LCAEGRRPERVAPTFRRNEVSVDFTTEQNSAGEPARSAGPCGPHALPTELRRRSAGRVRTSDPDILDETDLFTTGEVRARRAREGSLGNRRYGFSTVRYAGREPEPGSRRPCRAGSTVRSNGGGIRTHLTRSEVSVSSPPTTANGGSKPRRRGNRGNRRNGVGLAAFVDKRSNAALHHPELLAALIARRTIKQSSHGALQTARRLADQMSAPPSVAGVNASFPPSGPRAYRASCARRIRVSFRLAAGRRGGIGAGNKKPSEARALEGPCKTELTKPNHMSFVPRAAQPRSNG
jgi:hypothetical protein